MILDLFSTKKKHPFCDERELTHAMSRLPIDDSFKAIDEVMNWAASLIETKDLRPAQRLMAACKIDEAAQPHIRRLTNDYLFSPRFSQGEERHLWEITNEYWEVISELYSKCLEDISGRATEKASMGIVLSRLLRTLANQNKWIYFRYGQSSSEYWRRLGTIYLTAEQIGCLNDPIDLYAGQHTTTSVHNEYLHAVLLCASSPDGLLPLEIELTDRLISLFLPDFILSMESSAESVYWVDLASGFPPTRLASVPLVVQSSLRFVAPGLVSLKLADLQKKLDDGERPPDLVFDGHFPFMSIVSVIHHLALYWAPVPPMRNHPRYPIRNRLSVIQGFEAAWMLFSSDINKEIESWVVEDVSFSGFGALFPSDLRELTQIGTLLCLQPEGGENWLLGVVRRHQRRSATETYLGIETLSRQVDAFELEAYEGEGETRALFMVDSENSGQLRLVLPRGVFDLRVSRTWQRDGEHRLLVPITLIESGKDYEIGCYREYSRGMRKTLK